MSVLKNIFRKHCECLEKIILEDCSYIEDTALKQLNILGSSLQSLTINKCCNVTSRGILALDKLRNLKELQMSGLEGVENMDSCVHELKKSLPLCDIKHSSKKM